MRPHQEVEMYPHNFGIPIDYRHEWQKRHDGEQGEPTEIPCRKNQIPKADANEQDGDGKKIAKIHGADIIAWFPFPHDSTSGAVLVDVKPVLEDVPLATFRTSLLEEG